MLKSRKFFKVRVHPKIRIQSSSTHRNAGASQQNSAVALFLTEVEGKYAPSLAPTTKLMA